ncbi:MlaD family protein [Limisalsivibrio acetivorans]|uniref:MlaD family protein n=1 Tax=Limisalsivibrio acetivorans TaxID=1304888 RepID=UPI000404CDF6|nr:MlaD family protein [Limisalsivibrio acetivorans]
MLTALLLITVLLVTFFIKKRIFVPKIEVYIMSESGEGVSKSMPIKYAGFNISKVYDVELRDDGMVVLHTRIPKKYTKWIKKDSEAKLTSQNVIGSNYIVFTGGSGKYGDIEEGETFHLIREGGFQEIAEQAKPVIEDLKKIVANIASITETVEKQNQNLEKFFGGLGDVGDDLHNKTGSVGYLVRSDYLKNEVTAVMNRVEDLQENIHEISLKLDKTVSDANSTVSNVNSKVSRTDETITLLNNAVESFRKGVEAIHAAVESAQPAINNTNEVTGDIAESTDNLTAIRAEADEILRSTNIMLNNLQQRWPFDDGSKPETDKKLRLP